MGAKVIGVPAMPLPLYPELKLGLPGPAVSEALENFEADIVHVVNPAVLVVIPVITTPLDNPGAPVSSLFTISSTSN